MYDWLAKRLRKDQNLKVCLLVGPKSYHLWLQSTDVNICIPLFNCVAIIKICLFNAFLISQIWIECGT